MNTGVIVGLVILAIVCVFGVSMIGVGVAANNQAVIFETGIKAQYSQCQNNLSQYSNKVAEAAQVPTMYKSDFKEIVSASMQGRYGQNGSQAAMQWLKEHNIAFDSTLYVQLQRMIESGRNAFEIEQKTLIDKKRQYETALGTVPTGFVMKLIGFPKIDLAKYDIVKSGYATKAFDTKTENGITLR